MAEKMDYSQGIYDAKQLGTPKLLILGAQHMFAMFGATVLVPLLTGLSVSTTLLCAGLGTLLFHFLCKGKVPAFLGSSFAYLGGFAIVSNNGENPENLPYACAAVALSGLVYVLFSALISAFGIRKMMKFFPPVVTGTVVLSIGLSLISVGINSFGGGNSAKDFGSVENLLLALFVLVVILFFKHWMKGFLSSSSILVGIVAGYLAAIVMSFFVPKIFTAIAFDSGGVASGPMTATFLLPFAQGACEALGGNVVTDAFGVVAMVAMTPLLTIQMLGLLYQLKMKRAAQETPPAPVDEEIIEL